MPGRSSTTRSRAPHLGPERRRPLVLDAARKIANARGLGAVTIGSIATELGVTRPVVYSCYPGRVELIEALLNREEQLLLESVLTALHSSGTHREPEDAFVHGMQALLSTALESPDTWRLLLAGQPDPAVAARFRAGRAVVTSQATKWLRPAMERWWDIEDLDRKLPVLIELFMSSCESAVRSLLAADSDWTAEELGEFVGRATYRVFSDA